MVPNRMAFALLTLLVAVWTVPATPCAQSTTSNSSLTNRDVIDLVSEGFSPEVIKAKIASSTCQFDTSVEALKTLKTSNVPQDVILAMVQTHPTVTDPKSTSVLRAIECIKGDTQVILWVAPGKIEVVSRLRCNEKVTILAEKPPWVLVKTEGGLKGYLPDSLFNGQNTPTDSSLGPTLSQSDVSPKQRQETKRTTPPVRTVQPQLTEPRLSSCVPAVESTISGEFTGWEGETIFKLDNGQIWQQAEFDYTYDYEYRPDVTIYQTSSGCRLKVEDVEETIIVRRIK